MSKVIIVEDSQELADLVGLVLTHQGHEFVRDPDGSKVMELVHTYKPDLIVLDVTLPKQDGYTIQKQLAHNEETSHIPILVMTSKGTLEDLFHGAPNVVGFISKPFGIQDFGKQISALLKPK